MIVIDKIFNEDCLEGMKNLQDNSVDAVVTDPPYGLSAPPDIIEVLKHWIDGKDYSHNGAGFMNKDWDSFVPNPSVWREVYRVLKPGGHILCFAGTRTQDLMGISLRLAGFEIRDVLQWLYGEGFPKSMDISKAIDKKLGVEREVVGENPNARPNSQPNYSLDGKNKNFSINVNPVTAPTTEQAKQWVGYGTSLKPAYEPIILARKPISEKTIAENVMKWGTGGINIDESRIPIDVNIDKAQIRTINRGIRSEDLSGQVWGYSKNKADTPKVIDETKGRFPANVIIDEVAGAMIDEQSGVSKSTNNPRHNKNNELNEYVYGGNWKNNVSNGYDDLGGASRFFYTAKASKKERGEGNNHPTVKPIKLIEYLVKLITPENGVVLDPYMGSGTTAIACINLNKKFIGYEMDSDYYEIALKRIDEAKKAKESLLFGG